MNGKGDKWRRGTNYTQYWDNFDEIFRKDIKIEPSIEDIERDKPSIDKKHDPISE